MIHRSNLELIVEDWYDIALRMKNDEKANKAFGWILEMVCGYSQNSLADALSAELSRACLSRLWPWLCSLRMQSRLLRRPKVHCITSCMVSSPPILSQQCSWCGTESCRSILQ